MATCNNCGKTLILKDGKCLKCGAAHGEKVQVACKEPTKTGLPPVRTFTVDGVSFNMILVEGGTFWMGEQTDPRKPNYDPEARWDNVKQVRVDTFYIAETLVTFELYGALFYRHPEFYGFPGYPSKGIKKHTPVFIESRDTRNPYSEMASRTGEFFRVPTYEEWEFAARGGNKSKGYRFAGSDILEDVGWYSTNHQDYIKSIFSKEPSRDSEDYQQYKSLLYSPLPVKMKKPNELGIYDMSGLLPEPCYRVDAKEYFFRGGSFLDAPRNCRIATWNGSGGDSIWSFSQFHDYSICENIGIRLAMTPRYEGCKQ